MKKWIFFLCPVAMLVLFLGYYKVEMRALDERDARRAAEVAGQNAAAAAHKKAVEDQARAESDKRAAQAAAEIAAKEAQRESKWDQEGREIRSKTDYYNAEAARYAQRAEKLTAELKSLDELKEKENRADFELLKEVEALRVAKQIADMEIGRMVAMISKRADEILETPLPSLPKR